MNAQFASRRILFLFTTLFSVVLLTAHTGLADVRVQFVPSSGTAPLQGGLWSSLAFPGTVAAVTGTFSSVDTSVATSGTLSVSVTGGATSGTNTQAQFARTRSAVTVSGSGGFTEGPLYQSYGGYATSGSNSLWLSLSGVKPSTWFLVELYAFDNGTTGGTTFTDATAGSASTSGSIAYTAGATFKTNSEADSRFSVILAVLSDATGKILIKGSGANGGSSYAILNGFRISSKWIPKVYVPTLNATERVVAAVTPQQFGAKGDGVTDDTVAFQNAINFVYHTGVRAGGVVYVPAATYAFYGNLNLPGGVTLHGDWTNWTTGTAGALGTTFAIYTTGSSTGTPFLTLAGNDSVIGLNFWYPNQDPSNITAYPYTLKLSSGNGLEKVVLINSFQGVNVNGNEYSLRGVYGSPLATGIQVDGGADWASTADINFTPTTWAASKLPNAPVAATGPHAAWMLNNGTGMVLMRIDGINCIQTNISGYGIGVNMAQSSGGSVSGVSMPAFYSGTIQNCITGVLANYMPGQQGLQMTNFTISAGTAMTHTIGGFFIHLENCVLTGTSGAAVVISNTDSGAWNSFFQGQDCTFNGTIVQNSGVGNVVSCTLNSGTQCVLGPNVCKTAFAGCTFSPSQRIVNNAATSALLISSSGATLAPSPVLSPGIAWIDLFSAYQACQPTVTDLFVATDYGTVGDGNNDDTAAIQAALSAAAANGGGIVYLPGGHYKISNSVIVPTGVELRGVHEGRHNAGTWPDNYCKASVLQPTAGTSGSSGPPAVILSATSGIRGVDVCYESQDPSKFPTAGATVFPPTIQGRGANVYALACTLPNSWIGIDLDTYTCPNHYISMIYGVVLDTFIKIGNGSSGCIVDTEKQLSFWRFLDDTTSTYNYHNMGLDSNVRDWEFAHVTTHWWGDCNEKVAINTTIHSNIAVHCVSENGRGPTVVGVVQTNDNSNYGFWLEGAGTSNISLANSWMVLTGGEPILSTASYQGVFRLFNSAIINSTAPMDYSIAGGDVGLQVAYFQIYAPLGAQVTGGVLNIVNQCNYICYNAGSSDRFPAYPLCFSGTGLAGNASRVVSSYSYNGFAVTSYPGSVASVWGSFSQYTKPAIPKPAGGGTLVATGPVGVAFSYLIPASESPTSYNAPGLPAGLSVNTITGMISGTPTVVGTTSIVLAASNAAGSGTAGLTVQIVPLPPSFTSALSATGTQWNGFSYQIAGTNAPYSFTATGLPTGLSVDSTSGIISGIPTVAGTSAAQISASNDGGTSPSATLTLIIQPPPLSVTSVLTATGTDRSPFSYQITANNSPIGYGAANLPPGLGVNISSGVLSGAPATTGTFLITISAFNVSGTTSAILTLSVAPTAPLITSTLGVTGTNGAAFGYQIQGTDNPTGYSATGLPTGLSINSSSGLISGTPTVTGTNTATIVASNAVGSGSAGLVIGILPPPPPVPTSLTGVSGSGQIALSWKASTGAASYNLKRSVTAGSGFLTLANLTGTSAIDTEVINGTLYYYVITAVGTSGVESANSNSVGVMTGTLPTPWIWQNISASNIGGANYSGSTFAIAACGSDIWSQSDSFGFVYQTGGTSCRIIARVTAVDNINGYAKAGVMIRETLAANSAYVDAVLEPNGTIQSQSRSSAGASAINNVNASSITAPYWVKLIRSGTAFTTYVSSNGTSWTYQTAVAVPMAPAVYVGMPVTSHNTAAICSATFDNVSVSGTLPAVPQLSNYLSPAVLRLGDSINYQISASNSPAYYTAAGLPSGLTLNSTTGKITGVPVATGTSVMAISAGNDGGADTDNLTMIVIPQSQVITSAPGITGTGGSAFSYQITANNSPTSYTATGLPDGMSVNTSTGLISGTPTATGTFNANISAGSLSGTGSSVLILTILPPAAPFITNATITTGTIGTAFNFQIMADSYPTSYGANGLPNALTIDTSSGLISGTPTATGTFNAGISATNAIGTGTASLMIAIVPPPPIITSPAASTGTNGIAFSYQITATNNPRSYGASGLPVGLAVNPATGLITGTPTISGSFTALIIASNEGGQGAAPLTITFASLPGAINTWTWDPLMAGNGSDGSGIWDNAAPLFSSGAMDVIYAPGVVTKSVGITSIGANTITVTNTTGLVFGEALSLSNFSMGTVNSAVSGTTVTLTTPATSSVAANTSFTFVDANDVAFGNGTAPAGMVTVSGSQYAGSMTINPAGSGTYSFSNGTIVLGTRYGSKGTLTLNDSTTVASAFNFKGITFATAGKTVTMNGGSGIFGYNNGIITGTNTAASLGSSVLLSSGTYTTGGVVMWDIGDMTSGTAGLSILPGATFNQTYNVFIGYFSNNPGFAKLNGGIWNITNSSLVLGRSYAGGVNVQSGTLNAQGVITVGMNVTGVLNLNGGSLISSTTLAINSGNGNGTVSISGGTATLASVSFGGGGYGGTSSSGSGALNMTGGSLFIGSGGIISIGGGTTACTISLSGGTVGASADWSSTLGATLTGTGGNTVIIQAGDSLGTAHNISLSGVLSGTGGLIKAGGGCLTLSGSNTYYDGTTVNSGTLIVNNTAGSGVGAGPVAVSSGATFAGTGIVSGSVTVDGRLSPGLNSSGTLTINGGLSLNGGSSLQYGAGGGTSLIRVNGNVTLGGTLNAFDAGGFTSGTYRLISYTGSLTNYGLAIGSMPSYSFNYRVDTSIAGQVNLVVSNITAMETWKASIFGAGAANLAISGDTVVNNAANIANLMAYALGLNPFAAQSTDLPIAEINQTSGNKYLSLKFQRNTTATDITYIVESTGALINPGSWTPISTFANGTWLPVTNVTESGSGSKVGVQVSDTTSTISSPARFIRLKVIH